jgi:hypothetical protein
MTLAEAIKACIDGKKVKLPEWEGYWFADGQTIKVFTKTGDVLDTPWFDKYEGRTDFEICEPKFGFDFAIRCLKVGKRVARQGWNGKGMYLWLLPAAMVKAEWCKEPHLKSLAEAAGGEVECLGSIRMKTADDKILTGWLASQTDMLSEDWVVLP